MTRLLRFPGGCHRDPAVTQWLASQPADRGVAARHWWEAVRACGPDVVELLHDKHPTACIGDAAFAYLNVFTRHINVGFFLGAHLPDPHGLLEGTGTYMRHVKVHPGQALNDVALAELIRVAYLDMRERVSLKAF